VARSAASSTPPVGAGQERRPPAAVQAAPARPPHDGSAPARADADAGDLTREQRITELGLAFRRVSRALNRLRGRDSHLAGTELSHAQFQLLIELHERGELPTGELAAAAELAPGTVTQMLDALVAFGHVERDRTGADRRVVVTRLTPAGRRAIEAKRKLWKGRWEAALEGVSERDLRAAANVLGRLAGVFEQVPAEPGASPPQDPTELARRGTKRP
jgi:DNA-binding MarR family transcriptional regulator